MACMGKPITKKNDTLQYFRKRIPEDVQRFFIGPSGKPRKEYWESLGTHDPKEALQEYPKALAKFNKMVEVARKKLEAEGDKEALSISERDLKALAGEWLKKTLADDGHKADGDTIELLWLSEPIDEMLEAGALDRWKPEALEIIQKRNLEIIEGSQEKFRFQILM